MRQVTLQELETLAADARPRSDGDWGSERQVEAENLFCDRVRSVMSTEEQEHWDHYSLKATSEEFIDYAMVIARRAFARWALETP